MNAGALMLGKALQKPSEALRESKQGGEHIALEVQSPTAIIVRPALPMGSRGSCSRVCDGVQAEAL